MLLDKLNLASCWNGFLNEMERKCLTLVWSKNGGTHWWPNTPNSLFMFTLAELGFNSSQEWSVPPWISLSPWPQHRGTKLHKPITFPMAPSNPDFLWIYSFISHCVLGDKKKPQTWASLPFGALTSSSLAGFLAPSWSFQLSHHPAWCLPQWAQSPSACRLRHFHTSWAPLTTPPLCLATGLTAPAFITALLFSSLPP